MARAKKKQATRQDNWESTEGNLKPTKERQSKSKMRLVDGENAGERYAMDDAEGMAGHYHSDKVIDYRQLQAARYFQRIATAELGESGRSCLNFEPVGHQPEEDTPQEIAIHGEWRTLGGQIGAGMWSVLLQVCWENVAIDHREHTILRNGLDKVADFYKI